MQKRATELTTEFNGTSELVEYFSLKKSLKAIIAADLCRGLLTFITRSSSRVFIPPGELYLSSEYQAQLD